jgi:hypothetical protein
MCGVSTLLRRLFSYGNGCEGTRRWESLPGSNAGTTHTARGRQAAALDARGAAFGYLGLAAFAFTVGEFLPTRNSVAILLGAMAAWLIVAVLTLRLRQLRFLSAGRKS